jgi:hypothetical protein
MQHEVVGLVDERTDGEVGGMAVRQMEMVVWMKRLLDRQIFVVGER